MTKIQVPASERLVSPTIPGEFVLDALQACRLQSVDINALLLDVGLEPLRLGIKGNRVSVVDYAILIERLIATLDDGFLGFLDDRIPVKAFSVFACQLAGCHGIEEVLHQANRFYALFTSQFSWELRVDNETAIMALNFKETQAFDYRFIYQSLLLVMVRIIHWFVGEIIPLKKVAFSFEKTHLDKHLKYLFDCPLKYSRPRNEIHMDAGWLAVRCSTNLDQVNLMLRDSTRMMLTSCKSAPFTHQVRKALVLNQERGWPDIDDIANTMHLSKNLLWRKLKKENTSFLQIRDEVKRDVSISLLNDVNTRILDVAEKVGFSDASAFNKAFVKWTGMSPSKYREISEAAGNS